MESAELASASAGLQPAATLSQLTLRKWWTALVLYAIILSTMARLRIYPPQIIRACDGCDQLFKPEMRDVMDGNGRFCSMLCSSKSKRFHGPTTKSVTLVCSMCTKEFLRKENNLQYSKSGLRFCSRACKDAAQRIEGLPALHLPHYKDGADFYRVRAIRYYGAFCMRCGYNEYERMLDVHHRDHDRQNNKIENLEVLCVWCHLCETRGIPFHKWWTTRDLNSAVLLDASETTTPSSPVAR